MKSLSFLTLALGVCISLQAKESIVEHYAFVKANSNLSSSTKTLPSVVPFNKKDSPTIKVALLLDTSNSMDGLIDQAKAQLWELVNELSYAKCGNDAAPDLKIALYEYGNDKLNAKEGYIRQVNGFSNDLDEISKNLFTLSTNGGEEYCGNVIQKSLNQLEWGTNTSDLNLIFIAGNESFDQGPVSYKNAASEACGKDVTINTVFCGNYNLGSETFWKDGASRTNGDYIAINSDRATVHIPSPYDDKILERNKALNKTYVSYGSQGTEKMILQSAQDSNAKSYGEANAVKRAVSKSSRFYKNSSWDLVDALEDNEEVVSELKETELPAELKGKSTSEMKKYLQSKKEERVQIQQEIAELNSKRKTYVAKKTNDEDNELRNALIDAIKRQGKIKNYSWK